MGSQITGPDGKPLTTGQLEAAEQKKLRGGRIEKIRKDLRDDDLTGEKKMLRYSSHLGWFMDRLRELFIAQENMQRPGIWNKSFYSVGFTNGLVMAMAIFLEETARPPYRQIPEKFDGDDKSMLEEKVKGYMITLVTQLEAVICLDKNGKPKGYGNHETVEEAFAEWLTDTVDHLQDSPVMFPELGAALDRINDFIDNLDPNDLPHEPPVDNQ